MSKNAKDFIKGTAQALNKRGISEETCEKWKYEVGTYQDKHVQIANYFDHTYKLIAQKLRFSDKTFTVIGGGKGMPLYGAHLWRDGGKKIVITEGEIDALSVSQLQQNKWPVVSIPNGIPAAKKSLQASLEWLEKFDEIVLCFDNETDEKKAKLVNDAIEECSALFTPGKCKVARLPLKDANEMLQAGRGEEVINAIWGAKTFRPDGILSGADTWDKLMAKEGEAKGKYPWADVNDFLGGLRQSELVTVCAGSGIGKSAICREIAYALANVQGETVGYIALEESVKRSALGFMSIEANRPLHISSEGFDETAMRAAWEKSVGNGRVYLYDHWGSCDSNNLLSRIRYLARGCGCGWIFLDHISIVISGVEEGNERRLIDNTMTKLRSIVEETGVGLILVSHLKRPEGNKGHEDGLQTSLAHLRGSAAIAQLSDIVIGAERDQQGESPNVMTIRVLKNRHSGRTGVAGYIEYDSATGRLKEVGDNPFTPPEESKDERPDF